MEEEVRALLEADRCDDAIALLDSFRGEGGEMDATLFYLLGNAWRKKGNWKMAIDNYLEAIAINPESPARQALEIANDILAFFNKDMYNQ